MLSVVHLHFTLFHVHISLFFHKFLRYDRDSKAVKVNDNKCWELLTFTHALHSLKCDLKPEQLDVRKTALVCRPDFRLMLWKH